MKARIIKSILTTGAFLLLTFSLINSARAGVIILFEEVNGDVVATTTGSIQVPADARDAFSPTGSGFYGDTLGLYLSGAVDVWRGGSFVESGLSLAPTSAEGDTFGYYDDELDLAPELAAESFYSPHTTWIWEGQTLESIGLDYLTSVPFLVYDRDGQTISFAVESSIPEPAVVSLLMGAGVLAFACVRRRSK
jgi:hypothetical protein